MGRYTTFTLLAARYPDVAKRGQPDVENAFIAGAEAEIDARFAQRYTVPFTPAPPAIMSLATDVAYYMMTRLQNTSQPLGDYLKNVWSEVAKGNFIVVGSDGTSLDQSNNSWAQNSYHTRFGPDSPVNWRVSSNEVQAIRDERGNSW